MNDTSLLQNIYTLLQPYLIPAVIGLIAFLKRTTIARITAQIKHEYAVRLEQLKFESSVRGNKVRVRDHKRLAEQQETLKQLYWPAYTRIFKHERLTSVIKQIGESDNPEKAVLVADIKKNAVVPNLDELDTILSHNSHLLADDSACFEAVLAFFKYRAVYHALVEAENFDANPDSLGAKWPEHLEPIFTQTAFEKQREYDEDIYNEEALHSGQQNTATDKRNQSTNRGMK